MLTPHRAVMSGRSLTRRPSILLFLSGFALAAHPAALQAQERPPAIAARPSPYAAYVQEAAQRFGIPESWIWAVMRVESRGQARAVSPKGAMGLMQIMPATWAALRARYGLGADPFDPRDNIHAGTAYLREMYERYRDPVAALAAYNAGPGRYDAHLATGRALPAETRAYIAALTPQVGGRAAVNMAALVPDWRDAPLFVARTTDVALAPSSRSEGAPNVDAAQTTRVPAATVAQTDGLFVARTDSEAEQ